MLNQKLIEWVLRIAIAGEFVGHGMFALQGKADWVKWFGTFGIHNAGLATKLLFLIGLMDLVVALVVLIKPMRWVLVWATVWGFWTALLRPIVGMPIWDFVERWSNWGAPLALYLLLMQPAEKQNSIQ